MASDLVRPACRAHEQPACRTGCSSTNTNTNTMQMYVLQCLLLECNLQKGAKHRDARPACADWHFFLLLHNNRSSWLLWCITNNKPINTWDRKWYFGSRLFGLRTDFRGSQCRYTDPNHRSTIYHSVILILWKRYAIHLCKNSLTFFSEK